HGSIGNLLLTRETAHLAEHPVIDDVTKGPGDLAAALFTAWYLRGTPPEEALRRVTASVYEALERAAARGADELMLETGKASLAEPTATIQLTRLPLT